MNTPVFTQHLRHACLLCTGIAALALGAPVSADETANIAGLLSLSIMNQEALPVSPRGGDMLLLDEARGTNRSTGSREFMQGASINNKEVVALLQGSGPQHGYLTFTKDGDQVDTKWSGSVTTTQSPDGKPLISFHGTWEQVSGSGRYQGIRGRGTYSGHYTSPKDYVVDWEGQSTLPLASR